jgi:hypothetical protein
MREERMGELNDAPGADGASSSASEAYPLYPPWLRSGFGVLDYGGALEARFSSSKKGKR